MAKSRTSELELALAKLIDSSRLVSSRWEKGDLAQAIRALTLNADAAEKLLRKRSQ